MINRFEKNRYSFPLATATLVLGLAVHLPAQTFRVLHTFVATDTNGFNGDGAGGKSALLLSGGALYGAAVFGGTSGNGTLFKISSDGTGFAVLHTFSPIDNSNINDDGAYPRGLISSGNNLYGVTGQGGTSGSGTVFTLSTDGTGFAPLYSFSAFTWVPSTSENVNSDGFNPWALILSGSTLYGTTWNGGNFGSGTIFSLGTDGSAFTNLYDFTATKNGNLGGNNPDGANPTSVLLSGNRLYGTAIAGGCAATSLPYGGAGTVFAVNADGTHFTTLHCFTGSGGMAFSPVTPLVLSGDTLYGTTIDGPYYLHAGTLFKINTNGTGFSILHTFTLSSSGPSYTNIDGGGPGGLVLAGNTLYGTASIGGTAGHGTVFAIHTDGTGFQILHTFTIGSGIMGLVTNYDGSGPGNLILSGNTLYGTTGAGGSSGNGTIFSISLPVIRPQLTIASSRGNLVVSWSTNASGFTLQSTTNLLSTMWSTNSTMPVILNSQYTVTNPISGAQQFYRLSQ